MTFAAARALLPLARSTRTRAPMPSAPESICAIPRQPRPARAGSDDFALIVTADDFGIAPNVSRGIIHAHLHGPVTATSLMVTAYEPARASIPLLEQAPKLDVGLHLVLSGGERPLTDLRAARMVRRDGRFLPNAQLWARAWTGRIDPNAVFDEICAQARQYRRMMGRTPAYVDGHHHAHQLPGIRQALLRAIDGGILPPVTRTTIEPPAVRRAVRPARARRAAADLLGRYASRRFRRAGTWTNDYYFGMLSSADLDRPFPWDAFLACLPHHGTVEWVVHPGLLDESLHQRDPYVQQRTRELEALTSPATRPLWESLRPHLSTKSSLKSRGMGHAQ